MENLYVFENGNKSFKYECKCYAAEYRLGGFAQAALEACCSSIMVNEEPLLGWLSDEEYTHEEVAMYRATLVINGILPAEEEDYTSAEKEVYHFASMIGCVYVHQTNNWVDITTREEFSTDYDEVVEYVVSVENKLTGEKYYQRPVTAYGMIYAATGWENEFDCMGYAVFDSKETFNLAVEKGFFLEGGYGINGWFDAPKPCIVPNADEYSSIILTKKDI